MCNIRKSGFGHVHKNLTHPAATPMVQFTVQKGADGLQLVVCFSVILDVGVVIVVFVVLVPVPPLICLIEFESIPRFMVAWKNVLPMCVVVLFR